MIKKELGQESSWFLQKVTQNSTVFFLQKFGGEHFFRIQVHDSCFKTLNSSFVHK